MPTQAGTATAYSLRTTGVLRPNLTLNLGVRYDFQQAPTDPQRMQTNFVPGPAVARILDRDDHRQDFHACA